MSKSQIIFSYLFTPVCFQNDLNKIIKNLNSNKVLIYIYQEKTNS